MNDNSRIAKNTLLLYVRMLFTLGVSLYTSRVILQNLGIEDFGIYSVVGSVVTMFVFLNSAMTSVTQRYLSFEIGRNNEEQLNKVFNISLVIHFGLSIIIVLISETVGLWILNNKMVIPPSRIVAANWVYQCSLFATVLMMISVPYNALIISREKMSAFAYISILDILLKLFIAIAISFAKTDRLILYASLIVGVQLIDRLIYGIYCNRKFVESKIKIVRYESLYKEMLVFASWGLLGHLSVIITQSVQNILLNVFFNPIVNAARGISVQVSNAIQGFSSNFQLSVEPQITKTYSVGNVERLHLLIINSSRYSLYLLYLLSLPLFLKIDVVLGLWLAEVPEYTASFVRISLLMSLGAALANPINIAVRATGKVKMIELTGGTLLVMNLPISYFCLRNGMKPISVFYVQFIIIILTQVLRLYFAKIQIDLPIREYLRTVLLKPFVVMSTALIIPVIANIYWNQNNILSLVYVVIISILSTMVSVYSLGLNNGEKIFLKTRIRIFLKK